jgi:hypothetical protein
VRKDLRIDGYFWKPKGMYEQKSLGNPGLDLPFACVGTFDPVTLKFQINKYFISPHSVYPLASPAKSYTNPAVPFGICTLVSEILRLLGKFLEL